MSGVSERVGERKEKEGKGGEERDSVDGKGATISKASRS